MKHSNISITCTIEELIQGIERTVITERNQLTATGLRPGIDPPRSEAERRAERLLRSMGLAIVLLDTPQPELAQQASGQDTAPGSVARANEVFGSLSPKA